MKASVMKLVVVCALLPLVVGCALAPLSPRTSAASIGKNEIKLQTHIAPTPAIGVIYGVGKNLDLGLELEQVSMGNAWGRYSFINNPSGYSFAANGGVFISTGTETRSNGWYAGLLLSNQFNEKLRWSVGYRHALLDYEYTPGSSGGIYAVDFDNPDDASVNGKLELSISVLLKPQLELTLGGTCQYLFKNTNTQVNSDYCYPIFGFSFFRI